MSVVEVVHAIPWFALGRYEMEDDLAAALIKTGFAVYSGLQPEDLDDAGIGTGTNMKLSRDLAVFAGVPIGGTAADREQFNRPSPTNCRVLMSFRDVFGDMGDVTVLDGDRHGPRIAIGCYPKTAHLTREQAAELWPLVKAFAEGSVQ